MPYYHLSGKFHPGTELEFAKNQAAFNEHLSQNKPRVKLAGPLLGSHKSPAGWVIIIEADDLEQAERYLGHSPYEIAGLYATTEVYELAVEVGRLG